MMPAKKILQEDYERAVKAYYRFGTYQSVKETLDITHKYAKKLVNEGNSQYPSIKQSILDIEEEATKDPEAPKSPVDSGIDPKVDQQFYSAAYRLMQKEALEDMHNKKAPTINPKRVKGLVMLREFGKQIAEDARKDFDILALPVDDMTEDELNKLATGKDRVSR